MTTPASTEPRRETLVDRAKVAQDRIEGRISNIGRGKYGRVLRMSRKPTPEEFRKTSAIAAIGIAILGAIGFAIWGLMRLIPQ